MAGVKASINFGLVYIPVRLFPAVRSREVSFNMIDSKSGGRIQYKRVSEISGEEVSAKDITKGYQYEDGKYVIFSDEELEKIKTEKDKSITIERFSELGEIDPIYYDKQYYCAADGSDRAFNLLLFALESSGKAGIARAVMGNRENLVAIRAKDGEMLVSTIFFCEDIQNNPAPKVKDAPAERELKMADSIIESMSGPFNPEDFKDTYREKLMAAIEAKIAGKEISVPEEKRADRAAGLLEALTASLEKLMPQDKKTTEAKSGSEDKKGKTENDNAKKSAAPINASDAKPAGKSRLATARMVEYASPAKKRGKSYQH